MKVFSLITIISLIALSAYSREPGGSSGGGGGPKIIIRDIASGSSGGGGGPKKEATRDLAAYDLNNCAIEKSSSPKYLCKNDVIREDINKDFLKTSSKSPAQESYERCLNELLKVSFGMNVLHDSNGKFIWGQHETKKGVYLFSKNRTFFWEIPEKNLNSDSPSIFKISFNHKNYNLLVHNKTVYFKSDRDMSTFLKSKLHLLPNHFKTAQTEIPFKDGVSSLESVILERVQGTFERYKTENTLLQNEREYDSSGLEQIKALLTCKNVASKSQSKNIEESISKLLTKFKNYRDLQESNTSKKEKEKSKPEIANQ